jgi:dUTP pyrophosphatase
MEERWTVAVEAPAPDLSDHDPDSNGNWDPLAEVMAEGESGEARFASEPPRGGAHGSTSDGPTTFDAVEELQFIRLSEKATLPSRAHDTDAGLDIYAAEGARISPGARVSVGTGLAVAIPEGLAGLLLPRSGLALKQGVTLVNSPGLIDPGYRGEVRIVLLNTDRTSDAKIAAGDRIAQLILVPIALASPLESDALDQTIRGGSGFGSSGS